MKKGWTAWSCFLLFVWVSLAGELSWAMQAQPSQQAEANPPAKRQPRAKSQEELAAYQNFSRAPSPDEQIRLVEDFLVQFPESELKEYAFQAATQAYQAKNDYAKVLTYGELTLAENPENLAALLILASAIPERTGKADEDRDEMLAEGEDYARRALEVLEELPPPAGVAPEQWEQTKRETQAASHAALGLIAIIREDFRKAESELREAASLAARPDPIILYRLGLSFSFQKKYDLALEALERAAAAGGVKLTFADGSTRDLVAEAKEFNLKAKGGTEVPAPEDGEATGSTGEDPPSEPESPR